MRNLKHFPSSGFRENSKKSPLSSRRAFERKEEEGVARRRGKEKKDETERPNHTTRPRLARPFAPSLRKDEQKRHHFVFQSNANVTRVTTRGYGRRGRARGREHL